MIWGAEEWVCHIFGPCCAFVLAVLMLSALAWVTSPVLQDLSPAMCPYSLAGPAHTCLVTPGWLQVNFYYHLHLHNLFPLPFLLWSNSLSLDCAVGNSSSLKLQGTCTCPNSTAEDFSCIWALKSDPFLVCLLLQLGFCWAESHLANQSILGRSLGSIVSLGSSAGKWLRSMLCLRSSYGCFSLLWYPKWSSHHWPLSLTLEQIRLTPTFFQSFQILEMSQSIVVKNIGINAMYLSWILTL